MSKKSVIKSEEFVHPYRVTGHKHFKLSDYDPIDKGKLASKEGAAELLQNGVERLTRLQEKLYAEDKWALLLIFQAMDAAGKDGTIKHVMSGINPQGCEVFSFKAPSSQELNHDYLWRSNVAIPERGRIGIFNRSYYEETLVVRVHPELLAKEKLPGKLVGKHIWRERFEDINAYERYLSHNGVMVRKFFLNVSKKEQKRRFLSRLDEPAKNWKFSSSDLQERGHWDEYMAAYQEMIQHTATVNAPWFVVPADNKWYTRLVVSAAIVDALESLDLNFPKVDAAKKKELAVVRKALLAEK
jgi:PPK2 family polyphosphate:nucleotide phosphotransferase